MNDLDLFTEKAAFIPAEDEQWYRVIDDYVYTLTYHGKALALGVSLPPITRDERGLIESFANARFSYFQKIKFTHDGAWLLMDPALARLPDTLVRYAVTLSAYLKDCRIEFADHSSEVAISRSDLYVFLPVEDEGRNYMAMGATNIFEQLTQQSHPAPSLIPDSEDPDNDFGAEQFEVSVVRNKEKADDPVPHAPAMKAVHAPLTDTDGEPDVPEETMTEAPEAITEETVTEETVVEPTEEPEAITEETVEEPAEESEAVTEEAVAEPTEEPEAVTEEAVAGPAEEPEVTAEEAISGKGPRRGLIFLTYAALGIAFFLLVILFVWAAPVIGYLMGWLVSLLYVRSGRTQKSPFGRIVTLSALVLTVSGALGFLIAFLSQTELYTIYDYVNGSIHWAQTIFAVVLGIIFAGFGCYSTLPAKKKKKIAAGDAPEASAVQTEDAVGEAETNEDGSEKDN